MINENLKKIDRDEIWRRIQNFSFPILTYKNKEQFRSRPMTIVQKHFEGRIFIFSHYENEDYLNEEEFKEVTLTFSDKNKNFMVLRGKAKLSNDQNIIDQLWNSKVSLWYPKGKKDSSLCLIEIVTTEGEIWETQKGFFATKIEELKSRMEGRPPKISKKIDFSLPHPKVLS